VPGRPTGVTVGGGAVWVTTGDVPIDVDRQPLGIAVAGGSVWVASMLDETVTRIDPASNRVVATIPVPGSPAAVAAAGGTLWVSGNRGLSRIDPASNQVTPVGVCCGDLAAGAGALWVASGMDNTVLRVDPVSGRVVARIPVPTASPSEGPFRIAAADGAVWVTGASTEPRPGDPLRLWRVDAAGNRFAGSLRVGTVDVRHVGLDVAAGPGAVWVAVGDSGSVLRIRPRP
jgi:YVTN family beta-propeller protein